MIVVAYTERQRQLIAFDHTQTSLYSIHNRCPVAVRARPPCVGKGR